MRILVLQHVSFEGPAGLLAAATWLGATLEVVRVDQGGLATAPAFDPADYAGAYDGCDIPSRHVVRADGAGLVIDYGPGGDRVEVFGHFRERAT